MKYARSETGLVVHVVSVDPASIFDEVDAPKFRECADEVEVGWSDDGETFTSPIPPTLEQRQASVWNAIKMERDRRTVMGVKVGSHWFHSNPDSRIQQIALVIAGQNIPPNLQWKTLRYTNPPVFVTMTPTLAVQVFSAAIASDTTIFAAAEAHRMAMELAEVPEEYDFLSGGWPVSIEEEAANAGFTFDKSVL